MKAIAFILGLLLIACELPAVAQGEKVLPSETKEIKVSPEILKQYTGTYKLQPGIDATITIQGSQIFCQITGMPNLQLYPESETKYSFRMQDWILEFFKNDKGMVAYAVFHQSGNDIQLYRVTDQAGEEKRFDGTWEGTAPGPDGNPIEITYEFESVGKGLIGTVSTRLGGGPFSGGKIEGNKISFFVNISSEITIYTNGTLSGDVINMTQKKGDEVKQFTVKRVTPGK